MATEIPIDKIILDGGTQSRVSLDQDTILEYAEVLDDLPPVELVSDGKRYWPHDGNHRIFAAKHKGRESISAEVTEGTQRDAVRLSCGANAKNGLRRSNADKRKAVETFLNDEEWVQWSDNKIAEAASVSVQFVSNVRRELSTVDSSPAAKADGKPRIGRDGKSRRTPVSDYFDGKNSSTAASSNGKQAGSGKAQDAPADSKRRKKSGKEVSTAKMVDAMLTSHVSPLAKGIDNVAEKIGWKRKTKRVGYHAEANDALNAFIAAVKKMRSGKLEDAS